MSAGHSELLHRTLANMYLCWQNWQAIFIQENWFNKKLLPHLNCRTPLFKLRIFIFLGEDVISYNNRYLRHHSKTSIALNLKNWHCFQPQVHQKLLCSMNFEKQRTTRLWIRSYYMAILERNVLSIMCEATVPKQQRDSERTFSNYRSKMLLRSSFGPWAVLNMSRAAQTAT